MKFLGLDVGTKRIGVAKADSNVKIAIPYGMIDVDGTEFEKIVKLARIYGATAFIIGLPRNNEGEETAQSRYVRVFARNLKIHMPTAKIKFQDESLTSVQARENLKNKKGGINKKQGDVDIEAAVIILQDYLESLLNNSIPTSTPLPAPSSSTIQPTQMATTNTKSTLTPLQHRALNKKTSKKQTLLRSLLIILASIGLCFVIFGIWFNSTLKPISNINCALTHNAELEDCKTIEVKIEDGDSVSEIASKLKEKGLIKSAFAFKLYSKFNKTATSLKSGVYNFKKTSSLKELVDDLINGATDTTVFRITILPGETLKNIKKQLISIGYSEDEISTALSKTYSHSVLADKPEEKSLEGYLFGETYEFYQGDSVETIIATMLDQLETIASKNNLKNQFAKNGLSFYEGIVLASIVQKEAGNLSLEDQKNVASVFYNRLKNGMPLGSDVTVTYALDQLSADERAEYSSNAEKLIVDSCYNTRLYAGLPCGPISNPGASALTATANPSDTPYLYFLTGDDGMMYYSTTDSGHLQNIRDHCQELCNIEL